MYFKIPLSLSLFGKIPKPPQILCPKLLTLVLMRQALHICIPVFNESIGDLLAALGEEQKRIPHADIAVFIIDDASTDLDIRRENARVAEAFGATYIQQEENAGRSKTRNAFLKVTSAPWLLFLDGDSLPARENFLEEYLSYLTNDPEVSIIYGGTQYPRSVDDVHRLHHAYATDREALPVEARRKNPVGSFHANNFLIRRELLESYPFEERLTHYGHEDSLLAIRLALAGIPIQHMDNPVQHLGLVDNATFLQKTQQAVRHLAHIHHCLPAKALKKYSSLWKWYVQCRWFWPHSLCEAWSEGWMNRREEEMRAGEYHPRRFAMYKLLYLLQLDPLSRMHS